jgi:hypothetical protein
VERYGDRIKPSTYETDEVVGVGPASQADRYEGWIWIPERLFARMQHIATAYALHVVPNLKPNGRNALGREQTEGLLDEIEFIAEVTADPALHEQVGRMREVALRTVRALKPPNSSSKGRSHGVS